MRPHRAPAGRRSLSRRRPRFAVFPFCVDFNKARCCISRRPLAVRVTHVGREIELRRHTDADGDVLTPEGVAAALEIGARLRGGYHLAVSTGAQRATQTLACFLVALGERVQGGVVVEPRPRSQVEDRWRSAYQKSGSGALGALREADPELVTED